MYASLSMPITDGRRHSRWTVWTTGALVISSAVSATVALIIVRQGFEQLTLQATNQPVRDMQSWLDLLKHARLQGYVLALLGSISSVAAGWCLRVAMLWLLTIAVGRRLNVKAVSAIVADSYACLALSSMLALLILCIQPARGDAGILFFEQAGAPELALAHFFSSMARSSSVVTIHLLGLLGQVASAIYMFISLVRPKMLSWKRGLLAIVTLEILCNAQDVLGLAR